MHAPPAELGVFLSAHIGVGRREATRSVPLDCEAFHLTGFPDLMVSVDDRALRVNYEMFFFLPNFFACGFGRATSFLIRPKPRAYTRPHPGAGITCRSA